MPPTPEPTDLELDVAIPDLLERLRARIGSSATTVVSTADLELAVAVLERDDVADAVTPDEEEAEAMEHLLAYMELVTKRWGLRTNEGELTAAIHVLQGFVIQHMLRRLAPSSWSLWYTSQATTPHEATPASRAPTS